MSVYLSKKAQQHVQKLADRSDGRITPDKIVADAKKKTSPLHHLFEWNKDRAAMEHWRQTARAIIQQVRVNVTTEHRSVNVVGYVRDPAKHEENEQGYLSIRRVADNHDDAGKVMDYELGRAEASLRRVMSIGETFGMEQRVRDALAEVIGMRRQARSRGTQDRMRIPAYQAA